MDDVHVRAREERERLEDLLRKLADEVERDPVELRVLQEFVKIVAARARRPPRGQLDIARRPRPPTPSPLPADPPASRADLREHLEDETLVVSVLEVVQQPHDVVLVLLVAHAQRAEQLDLRARLQSEGLLALDDLDRDVELALAVVRLDDLRRQALRDRARARAPRRRPGPVPVSNASARGLRARARGVTRAPSPIAA